MARNPIDEHLASFTGVQRESLEHLRQTLREILPGATECISYGIPCFKVDGKAVAGFSGYARHNSYFPHSGRIVETIDALPTWCEAQRGTLRFPIDRKLPKALVKRLVKAKLAENAAKNEMGRHRSAAPSNRTRKV